MPIPYASIPSASLKLASFPSEVPAGRIAIFSLAKENIPTLGSPKISDSITGTALSLARKDYDSPLLVLHNSDSDFPGRFAYSSKIEIIEFFLNDLQLLFLWLFRFSGSFRSLDDLLGFLGDLLGLFFALLFDGGDLFRLLGQRIFFLFLGSLDCFLL